MVSGDYGKPWNPFLKMQKILVVTLVAKGPPVALDNPKKDMSCHSHHALWGVVWSQGLTMVGIRYDRYIYISIYLYITYIEIKAMFYGGVQAIIRIP